MGSMIRPQSIIALNNMTLEYSPKYACEMSLSTISCLSKSSARFVPRSNG